MLSFHQWADEFLISYRIIPIMSSDPGRAEADNKKNKVELKRTREEESKHCLAVYSEYSLSLSKSQSSETSKQIFEWNEDQTAGYELPQLPGLQFTSPFSPISKLEALLMFKATQAGSSPQLW